MNVACLLEESAARVPDRAAFIWGRGAGRKTVTFGRFAAIAESMACELARHDIRDGDFVLVLQPMSVALYAALVALFRIGAVAVLPDPAALKRSLIDACRAAPPAAMIAPARVHIYSLAVPELRRIARRFSTDWRLPGMIALDGRQRASHALYNAEPDHPALVTFTSGSTGTAKGVVRSHGMLAAQNQAVADMLGGSTPPQRRMTNLPVFTLSSLASGVTSVVPDTDISRPAAIDPDIIASQIAENAVDQLVLSPVLAELLARGHCEAALAGVRSVYLGGAPVFPDIASRLARALPQSKIEIAYGSSEAEPIAGIAANAITARDLERIAAGGGLPVGMPIDRIAIAICQLDSRIPIGPFSAAEFSKLQAPRGTVGEICATGDHVMKSYLGGRGDAETKFSVDGRVWHRTGDAGWLDADNRIWLCGRASEGRAIRGKIIHPLAIEAACRMAAGPVRVACVVDNGTMTIVVEQDSRPLLPRLRSAVDRIGPVEFALVNRVPTDRRHNSKIDYAALRRMPLAKVGA